MRDTKDIQAELDHAQADLERNIAELKHVIEDKLEGPRHVIEVVERPVSFVRAHALLIGIGVCLALGLLMGRLVPSD